MDSELIIDALRRIGEARGLEPIYMNDKVSRIYYRRL